ncbi:F-box/FBD/LRR-repeat protein At3g26920-like [Zingiber officinale]|uniref:F-box/FBD/LRR-repeat protein At3g26920-like n=1 Tax=Zingiber officinale TaxID=94328 RepID=UPI001C4D1CB8|nr:F-box/FBD/LRR-repeat protein At3g26920-like [Zingiber officinale]XP_042471684.1 F-box/FBD/LRR-repeat protein At3g26920-like [Zingiber officinale]
MADPDNTPCEPPAVRRHRRRRRSSIGCRRNDVQQQDVPAEDRLTSLPEGLLFCVLSFLPIKQCVALSALCSDFRLRLPSLIPRLDTFSLYVVGDVIPQEHTFPRALIRQCHIRFSDVTYLSKRPERLLVKDLVESGVQDLTLECSNEHWINTSFRRNCRFLSIRSLRSLSLHRITFRHRPPIACTLLTFLKMEYCSLLDHDFLFTLLASCPFLETLHFLSCHNLYMSKLSIHSASIKHLVVLYKTLIFPLIDIHCPKLESLTVNTTALRIEAPKVRNASLLLSLNPHADPSNALMEFLGTPPFRTAVFQMTAVCLMLKLNSSTIPNILAAENELDRFIYPEIKEYAVIFNFDFNLKDQSSSMILTQLLQAYNDYNSVFDIQSTNETTRVDHLLHGSTDVELIKLQMSMPEKMFEGFLSNPEKMEELKQVVLQKLRSRTSREQFNDILASNEPLVEVSSSITNCIEMKF